MSKSPEDLAREILHLAPSRISEQLLLALLTAWRDEAVEEALRAAVVRVEHWLDDENGTIPLLDVVVGYEAARQPPYRIHNGQPWIDARQPPTPEGVEHFHCLSCGNDWKGDSFSKCPTCYPPAPEGGKLPRNEVLIQIEAAMEHRIAEGRDDFLTANQEQTLRDGLAFIRDLLARAPRADGPVEGIDQIAERCFARAHWPGESLESRTAGIVTILATWVARAPRAEGCKSHSWAPIERVTGRICTTCGYLEPEEVVCEEAEPPKEDA